MCIRNAEVCNMHQSQGISSSGLSVPSGSLLSRREAFRTKAAVKLCGGAWRGSALHEYVLFIHDMLTLN